MGEPEKITIIEGPPPTFEAVNDAWLLGLTEGLTPSQVALCRVRTFNGPSLVERCYRAWRDGLAISFEYRTEDGTTRQAPILAARWGEVAEGHVLMLWVRLDDGEIEFELDIDADDVDDEPDDQLDDGDNDLTQ